MNLFPNIVYIFVRIYSVCTNICICYVICACACFSESISQCVVIVCLYEVSVTYFVFVIVCSECLLLCVVSVCQRVESVCYCL